MNVGAIYIIKTCLKQAIRLPHYIKLTFIMMYFDMKIIQYFCNSMEYRKVRHNMGKDIKKYEVFEKL